MAKDPHSMTNSIFVSQNCSNEDEIFLITTIATANKNVIVAILKCVLLYDATYPEWSRLTSQKCSAEISPK